MKETTVMNSLSSIPKQLPFKLILTHWSQPVSENRTLVSKWVEYHLDEPATILVLHLHKKEKLFKNKAQLQPFTV